MDISVDRTITPEGHLLFSILVKDPAIVSFTKSEQQLMSLLDRTQNESEVIVAQDPDDNDLEFKISTAIHNIKSDVFDRVISRLHFNINNQLRPKFDPICQEIYNWIYDAQEWPLKTWMSEFNPQRTQFYFDNDIRGKRATEKQESEHEIEIDEEEENDL